MNTRNLLSGYKSIYLKKIILYLTIFVGMMLVSCENNGNSDNPRLQPDLRLVGKWAFVDLDGITLGITTNTIMLMPVVENPTPYKTLPYKWISKDSIEIEYFNWGGEMVDYFTTHNKVIFHTPDSATVTNWFYGQSKVDAPIYIDATIVKNAE